MNAEDFDRSNFLGKTYRILIVEDDDSIRQPLIGYLRKNKLRVCDAPDARTARQMLAAHSFDLIILDIMMPGEDGLSLCRFIREKLQTPVIFLTACNEETDRIVGLEIGADDYISKPFSPRELFARIRAVLRRSSETPLLRAATRTRSYAFADWVLKTDERALVGSDGVRVSLSTGEFNLLHAMVLRPHIVLTREQLLDLARGREADVFDRSIDNMISRLRRKVEADPKKPQLIKTVWGGGYMLSADVREL